MILCSMIKKGKVKMPNPSSDTDDLSYMGEISVKLPKNWGMITLKVDLETKGLKKIINDCFKTPLPHLGKVSATTDTRIVWMAPDELLILISYDKVNKHIASLEENLRGEHYLIADVSDARVLFNLKGEGVYDVLAKGTPADMSNFGVNEVRRSRIGQLAAAFWTINSDEIEVVCFRSVSDYLFDWLKAAAAPNSLPGYFK